MLRDYGIASVHHQAFGLDIFNLAVKKPVEVGNSVRRQRVLKFATLLPLFIKAFSQTIQMHFVMIALGQ